MQFYAIRNDSGDWFYDKRGSYVLDVPALYQTMKGARYALKARTMLNRKEPVVGLSEFKIVTVQVTEVI